jgi:hypothetical protein
MLVTQHIIKQTGLVGSEMKRAAIRTGKFPHNAFILSFSHNEHILIIPGA